MLRDPYRPLPAQVVPVDDDRITPDDEEAYLGQSERRLSLRLLNYWRHARGDSEFAARSRIVPAVIPEIWPLAFVISFSRGPSMPRFSYVGEEMLRLSSAPGPLKSPADASENSLLGKSTAYLDQVLRRRCPITIGGEFANARGQTFLYRSVMLPLSEDGATIDAILGAGNCKEKEK